MSALSDLGRHVALIQSGDMSPHSKARSRLKNHQKPLDLNAASDH